MQTRIDEIAQDIFRLSTFVAEVPPVGFTFNKYLTAADEQLRFHCGGRGICTLV